MRKVICSTNVAETSITVDDVTSVIDTMRVKEAGFDLLNNASTLAETFTSKASAKQRSGRAGRVRPGVCYRLVKEQTFKDKLKAEQLPEICRTPLERLVLTSVAAGYQDPKSLLLEGMDPPKSRTIDAALQNLMDLGAMKYDGSSRTFSLTGLGSHLASFPVDAKIGKLLVLGAVFRCVDPVLTIASLASERPLFNSPFDKRDEAQKAKTEFAWSRSDLLCLTRAYAAWRGLKAKGATTREEKEFCDSKFLSRRTLYGARDGRRQLAQALVDAGFGGPRRNWEESEEWNSNSGNPKVLKAILVAALYPNVVAIRSPDDKFAQVSGGAVAVANDDPRSIKFFARDRQRIFLHSDSVNFAEVKYKHRWAVYLNKWKNESRVFLRDISEITPGGLLLFAGGDVDVQHEKSVVVLDGWIRLNAQARTAVLARELRTRLDQRLMAKFNNPTATESSPELLEAFQGMLSES
mmetsp:Transcript_15864/g.39284  ORF Transcript_15864/g.39284 Transcript_15864/m.39284 type:complete len:465 (-) Transcript_15864:112-1506(-)